ADTPTPATYPLSLHDALPILREAVRKNLADLVAEESIIMSDGRTVIKVPIRSLEEYRFRFDRNDGSHVGQGDGRSRVGDVIGRRSEEHTSELQSRENLVCRLL